MTSNYSVAEGKQPAIFPISQFSAAAASLSYITSIAALVLVAALHFIKTDMAPSWHMVSEYAIGDYGWVMQLAFISWATSCIALASALRIQVVNWIGKIGVGLLFIVGLSIIMAGLCVIDSPEAAKSGGTMHGNLHALASLIGMPGHTIAAVLNSLGLARNPAWARVKKPILWSGHFTWISLLILFVTMFIMFGKTQGQFTPETKIGWANRLVVFAYCLWLIVVAGKLRSANRK